MSAPRRAGSRDMMPALLMTLAPGTRLGRYEVRARLGAGGMAEVFLGEDTGLGRKVALKLLPVDSSHDAHAERRLLREARAAATLDHPNICAVYDIGESDGRRFIAMQYVEGETLEARLRRQRLSVAESTAIGADVAEALAHAHSHGIVHRDIKPSNVMITPSGRAVVLDFGLAKPLGDEGSGASDAATESLLSAPGVVMGTVPYMSPEQIRGEPLDARSDIFSFGVMLYEMLSGARPFSERNPGATAAAILTRTPAPLSTLTTVPPGLDALVTRALAKEPDDRYQRAADLLGDLRALQSTSSTVDQRVGPIRSLRVAAIAGAVMLVGAASAWFLWQRVNARWAANQIPAIERLANAQRYPEAYDLAVTAERYLPGDAALSRLLATVAMTITVKSTPAGAQVYLARFEPAAGPTPAKTLVGTTPLTDRRVARGDYVLSIEKDGYAQVERAISGALIRAGTFVMAQAPVDIDQTLVGMDKMPARMVLVPGGNYRLAAWSRPTDRRVRLHDFYIDKYEVTNAEYKAFMTAGGYLKREYWTVPFEQDGRVVPWDDGMTRLVDRTGLPGPRSWSGQHVPDGKADHPVTDITWHEAAAFAAFAGKQLPTVFQWEKAARNGVGAGPVTYMPWGVFYPGDSLVRRANFENSGTTPVTDLAFGMSPFGAYNMAGNVAEWTRNDTSQGHVATGGAWGDPTYVFAQFLMLPSAYSSNKLGFRCVLGASGPEDEGDGGARIEIAQEIPKYTPSNDAAFDKWAEAYRYERTPLDSRVESVVETPEWRREKVSFVGADGERAMAYLYLPPHFARPLQVVHFVPAGDVNGGLRSLEESMEDRLAPFIKSGRAAFGVVLKGYIDRLRPEGFVRPETSTTEYLELSVNRSTDLRRGLDYLGTRADIDMTRVAFFGPSAGAQIGLVLAAVEQRYRAVVLIGAGLPSRAYQDVVAAANPVNFSGHIRTPTLMLHGLYDEDTPFKTAAEPLYALLPGPKKLVTYEGGHVPSESVLLSSVAPWLDETLGKVKR